MTNWIPLIVAGWYVPPLIWHAWKLRQTRHSPDCRGVGVRRWLELLYGDIGEHPSPWWQVMFACSTCWPVYVPYAEYVIRRELQQ